MNSTLNTAVREQLDPGGTFMRSLRTASGKASQPTSRVRSTRNLTCGFYPILLSIDRRRLAICFVR
jgi:hypothetical protein